MSITSNHLFSSCPRCTEAPGPGKGCGGLRLLPSEPMAVGPTLASACYSPLWLGRAGWQEWPACRNFPGAGEGWKWPSAAEPLWEHIPVGTSLESGDQAVRTRDFCWWRGRHLPWSMRHRRTQSRMMMQGFISGGGPQHCRQKQAPPGQSDGEEQATLWTLQLISREGCCWPTVECVWA